MIKLWDLQRKSWIYLVGFCQFCFRFKQPCGSISFVDSSQFGEVLDVRASSPCPGRKKCSQTPVPRPVLLLLTDGSEVRACTRESDIYAFL